jgi:catechol 2,3-dioxygenase-like lactoylglutathione lyase family enzyme
MDIKFEGSVIFVKDVKASRRFYEDLLGQKVEDDFGRFVGYEGGFGIWEADFAHQLIYDEPLEESGPLGKRNLELYFETEDIEEAWDRFSETAVKLVHPMIEQPWGQRVFRLYDPDGHIVEIGEPLPVVAKRLLNQGRSPEEVAEKTMMPLEAVKKIAENL